MGFGQSRLDWVGVLLSVLGGIGGAAAAPPSEPGRFAAMPMLPAEVPLEQLPPGPREAVRRVLERPTLSTPGPVEVFRGKLPLYYWLLDHPDQGVRLWRALGARCMEITAAGDGRFHWSDGQGTDIQWETVFRSPQVRVWYAEGSSKPASLLPAVPMRAVVVLHHDVVRDGDVRPIIRHHADLFLQTDSKTARLIARLLGPSAPRLAEQGVAQMELFFSALVWYFDRHPERAEALLGDSWSSPAKAD
jgi:hypothetical protein